MSCDHCCGMDKPKENVTYEGYPGSVFNQGEITPEFTELVKKIMLENKDILSRPEMDDEPEPPKGVCCDNGNFDEKHNCQKGKEYKKLADIIAKSVCKNEAFAWEDGAQTAKEFLLDKINEEEIIAILRQNFEKETKFKRADIAKAIVKFITQKVNEA